MDTIKIREHYKKHFIHGDILLEWMDDDYVVTLGLDEWLSVDNLLKTDDTMCWITVDGKRVSIRYSDKE